MTWGRDISHTGDVWLFVASFFLLLAFPTAGDATKYFSFTDPPPWESFARNSSWAVAVGDVDMDGDLDVVFGNSSTPDIGDVWPNTLYLSTNGQLELNPRWQSTPERETRSVALGDVDGDGDLDLVCGNLGEPNTLYLNVGGGQVFQTNPVWESDPAHRLTQSVMLADVDGDGNLDLVCGNGSAAQPEQNTVYLNIGTAPWFEKTPSWESAPARDTKGVALGDIDGNGYVDLVCGNMGASGDSNTVYLNVGGVLDTIPAWVSRVANGTSSVALGDINGDGLLDLACGNGLEFVAGDSNTVYLNVAGTLEGVPSWSSARAVKTESVMLGDVDDDGDLDLVSGNFTSKNRLYVNTGGVLNTIPAWASAPPPLNRTRGVALGDIDGDGDVDLVCANSGRDTNNPFNTLYDNEGNIFTATPDWFSGPSYATADIELGDINGDGFLDLVCANEGVDSNTVYLNTGGMLDTQPAWSTRHLARSLSVALGDVDGDGDLDAVFAVGFVSNDLWNVLYKNTGGVLDDTTSWKSVGQGPFGWGDFRKDGDLDLVALVDWDGIGGVFENEGGSLRTSASWLTAREVETREGGALVNALVGDINGDGLLDIVFTSGDGAGSYLTRGPLLGWPPETFTRWQPDQGGIAALGDIDGDGDLDIVFAIDGGQNTIYFNDETIGGGQFSDVGRWFSDQSNSSTDVVLGDADGDGDLDLVFANGAGLGAVYLNGPGGVATDPEERFPGGLFSRRVAVGDIDNDGDTDVVFGNGVATRGAQNTLHLGRKQPVFKGDPSSPTDQLPNNAAYTGWVRVDQPDTNLFRVAFDAFDVESDPVWVVAEYQFEGAKLGGVPAWSPVDAGGALGLIGPLAASSLGVPHTFDWDISRLPASPRDLVLRLRTISAPKQVSTIQHVATYLKPLGSVVPLRPKIVTVQDTLRFSTVTVGDTACVNVLISNTGNVPLTITNVVRPFEEMSVSPPWPFDVLPGDTTTVTVCLEPCTDVSVVGDVQFETNDPVTPVTAFGMTSDIRPLVVRTDLRDQATTVPLGDAVTVITTPAADVRVERGHLFYRAVGAATFQDSVPLIRFPAGDWFSSVIPGVAVTELGLEYYVRVENSCVVVTDPPGAPVDSLFRQAVAVPVEITTTPIPTGQSGFLEGRSIGVGVGIPAGASFVSGLIHHRSGGETSYQREPLEVIGPSVFGTVPDSLVGPRGVEYWVEVTTGTRTLTDPGTDPQSTPRKIRTVVPNVDEPQAHAGEQYRMVSVPLDFGSDFTGSLEALLAEQPSFGPYDILKWRCFRYDSVYAELGDLGMDDVFRVSPGKGYWLVARDRNRITTSPIVGTSTATDSMYEIVLEPGWNQIGNPFYFPVAWDAMRVDTLTMAQAELTLVVEPPVRWGGFQYRYDVTVLDPFEGYWVKNLGTAAVVLRTPAKEAPVGPPPLAPVTTVPATTAPALADEPVTGVNMPSGDAWRLQLSARSGDARDTYNHIGVTPGATLHRDPNDRSEAPMSPGPAISLYFPHNDWEKHPGPYTVDMRGEAQELSATTLGLSLTESDLSGHVWRFDLARNFEGDAADVALDVTGIETVPEDAAVYLIDHILETAIDLRNEAQYTFFQGRRDVIDNEEDARFTLLVGSTKFVRDVLPALPTRTVLHPNYPNPFNPTTVIRYELASAGEVTVRIYDVTGALVKTLEARHRDRGRYEVGWNATNDQGQGVASGIYFYRLRTPGFTQTRKMVLLK